MESIIYKLDIPECFYTYEVGKYGVATIEEDLFQTGVNDSKIIYRIIFDDKRTIEIPADIKGIIIFRKTTK